MIDLLTKLNLTISSVESFTAGKFIASLIDVPGASRVVKGGLVTYMTDAKKEFGINTSFGTISNECLTSMLEVGLKNFNTNIVAAFTGNAGPEAMEDKPVGHVHIGFIINGKTHLYQENFKGTRQEIQIQAIDFIKEELFNKLKKH